MKEKKLIIDQRDREDRHRDFTLEAVVHFAPFDILIINIFVRRYVQSSGAGLEKSHNGMQDPMSGEIQGRQPNNEHKQLAVRMNPVIEEKGDPGIKEKTQSFADITGE